MNKPLTVATKETFDSIVSIINSSNLPAFILRDMIGNLERELAAIAEREYNKDLAAYQRATAEEQEQDGENVESE